MAREPHLSNSLSLAGRNCLVLGAGGFIGTNLCHRLAGSGATVLGFGRNRREDTFAGARIEWRQGEFRDSSTLARAVEGQHVVFHLISGSTPESSNHDPAGDIESNVLTTLRLLDLCRSEGVERVVFASSGGTVYGVPQTVPIAETAHTDPICSYGIGKLAIEKYLGLYKHLHGLDSVVLRIANPYGPFQSARRRQGVVAAMIRQALDKKGFEIWGNGEVVRDFLHIDDVVNAMMAAAGYAGPARVMNVGSGMGLSINRIADDIEALIGRAVPRTYLPARPADVPVNVLDIALIQRELGWKPRISWQDGLARTLEWARA